MNKTPFYIFLFLLHSFLSIKTQQYAVQEKMVDEIGEQFMNTNGFQKMITTTFLQSNICNEYMYTLWWRNTSLHGIIKLNVQTGINQLCNASIFKKNEHKVRWPTALHMSSQNEFLVGVKKTVRMLRKPNKYYLVIKSFKDQEPDHHLTLSQSLKIDLGTTDNEIIEMGTTPDRLIAFLKDGSIYIWEKEYDLYKKDYKKIDLSINPSASIIHPSGTTYLGTDTGKIQAIKNDNFNNPLMCVIFSNNTPITSLKTSLDGTLVGTVDNSTKRYAIYNGVSNTRQIFSLPNDITENINAIYPITDGSCFAIGQKSIYILDENVCTQTINTDELDASQLSSDGKMLCAFKIACSEPCEYQRIHKITQVYKKKYYFFTPLIDFIHSYIEKRLYTVIGITSASLLSYWFFYRTR